MILDGWGIGDKSKGDVIYSTPTPYMDYLNANYPHSQLQASGENVGLPDGQMGNSEVGHLNIGPLPSDIRSFPLRSGERRWNGSLPFLQGKGCFYSRHGAFPPRPHPRPCTKGLRYG